MSAPPRPPRPTRPPGDHGAAIDALADTAGPQAIDELVPYEHSLAAVRVALDDEEIDTAPEGALAILRRGLAASPELRAGLKVSLAFAVITALGRLVIPVLIQLIVGNGIGVGTKRSFDAGYTYTVSAIGAVMVIVLTGVSRVTYLRFIRAAEHALANLRARVFDHIHRLSIAEHTDARKGVLVARVTSDIETLARFVQWGAMSWILNGVLVVMTIAVMLFYSWQLTLVVLIAYIPVVPILRTLQHRQLAAYDLVRTRTGDLLTEVSEAVSGAAVIRAYGLESRSRARLRGRIDGVYHAHLRAAKYFAMMFPLGDFFGAIAIAAVTATSAFWGVRWGLDVGTVVAFLFLVNLLLNPVAELSEILDQTQTAIAGWRKVLAVLDVPIEVADPTAELALPLPYGPLAIDAFHV